MGLAAGVALVAFFVELLSEALFQLLGGLHFKKGVKYLYGCPEAGNDGATATASLRVMGELPEGCEAQSAFQVFR